MSAPGTGTQTGSEALGRLVAGYVARRPGWEDRRGVEPVVLDSVVLHDGRPGLVDVVADVGGRRVHVALGLRALGDEARFLAGVEDPVLGLYEDGSGLAVAFDATADAGTATVLLEAIAGVPANTSWVRRQARSESSVGVVFDDRIGVLLFDELSERSRQWTTVIEALDDAGFTHVPAPVAFWRRRQYDLGMVRELLPGVVSGRHLALRSLRSLLAGAGDPQEAGDDFAGEAQRLGALVARLHLALDSAFGRRAGDVTSWSAAVAAVVRTGAPHLAERADVQRVLDDLVSLTVPCFAICSHGDLSLDRVGRTETGWYLVDPDPVPGPGSGPAAGWGTELGGLGPGTGVDPMWVGEPLCTWRSPLADVADVLWSFGELAAVAIAEQVRADDGPGRDDQSAYQVARALADAWERRNRRAFLGGYLAVPGIAGLVPPARHALRTVTSAFELEQSVRRFAGGAIGRGSIGLRQPS